MKTLSRSDIIMTRPGSMEEYQRFPATMLGWGLLPEPDRCGLPPLEECMRRVEEARLCGMKFQGRVEFDADWMGMIDYDPHFMEAVCLDLDGQPIVTWWAHRYRGHPPYNYCTNSPRYLEYLLYQVEQVVGCGSDMIMLDCVIPSITTVAKGGCFCATCKAGFSKYLKEIYSAEHLLSIGIHDIDDFDYQNYLKNKNVTLEHFITASIGNDKNNISLLSEFLDFQYKGASNCFRELRTYAYELKGEPIAFSTNAPYAHPIHSFSIEHMDYYTREIKYLPPKNQIFPSRAWFEFKVAESFGKFIACTACPGDFIPIEEQEIPGFCRLWIAHAFASGHNFMVPSRMWTRRVANQPDGWYVSNHGDYEPIYEFVSSNSDLIEDYEAVGQVAVVIDYTEFMGLLWNSTQGIADAATPKLDNIAGQIDYQGVCTYLALNNVPFRLVFAGNAWFEDQVAVHDFQQYSRILRLVSRDNNSLDDQLSPYSQLITDWTRDMETLLVDYEPSIKVIGADNILALPRYKAKDSDAPVVIHLLNLNYETSTDSSGPTTNFKIEINTSLFSRDFSDASLIALGTDGDTVCELVKSKNSIRVTVPSLDMWGILRLE